MMYTSDKRILEFLEICKSKGIIRFETDFCEKIGISKQQLYQIKKSDEIKKQNSHFTPLHIENLRKNLNANLDYIFGFSEIPFISKV